MLNDVVDGNKELNNSIERSYLVHLKFNVVKCTIRDKMHISRVYRASVISWNQNYSNQAAYEECTRYEA